MAAPKKPNIVGAKSDKLWRAAILMAVHELRVADDDEKATKIKTLRLLARRLVNKALDGDVTAMKEIGDRLDGRPSQSLDIGPPEVFTGIVRKIIDPGVESTQPSAPAGNGADEAEAIGLNATDGSESVEDVHDTKGKLNG